MRMDREVTTTNGHGRHSIRFVLQFVQVLCLQTYTELYSTYIISRVLDFDLVLVCLSYWSCPSYVLVKTLIYRPILTH